MNMLNDFVSNLGETYAPGSHCEDPEHTGCPKCDEDCAAQVKGREHWEREDLDFNED